MGTIRSTLLAMAVLVALGASPALALDDRDGRILGGTSAGFAVAGGETMFLTNLEADYFIDDHFSLGGQMLFGVSDFFIWAPQAVGKYTFDINGEGWIRDFKPYGEILMGLAVASNGSTEVGFLGGFGFGGDYFFESRWAVGTNMLFEFSNELAGENFGWFWKVVNVKYVF